MFGKSLSVVVAVAMAVAGCSSSNGSGPATGTSPTGKGFGAAAGTSSSPTSSSASTSSASSSSPSSPAAPSSSTASASTLPWRPSSSGVELTGDDSAFAARFDPAVVRFVLHAGSQVPGGSGWPGGDAADPSGLVAGWNGGFLMGNNASWGGFYLGGKTMYGPLRTGTASEVFYENGTMDVQAWPGGLPGADILGVRQNLALLISDGRLAANLADGTAADERTWGFTNNSADEHGNRSGIGVTADGKVVYAAVHAASPLQLAQYLQRAGAVRAMELDINFTRPIFGTYGQGRWTKPAPWLGPAERFTSGNERDFVVVYAR
ncbi:phosphodiester glycosidase family protein [Catenulispora sp. GP43]|uniref:phosphodiester glycosidase family protein n=1 Tax=Catenulispora sp. GP43 TaxID=3156263 RepID=UPI003518B9C5